MEQWLIGIVLTASTLVSVLEFTGLLPARVRRWVVRNKSDGTLEVLRDLGIDVDGVKRANAARAFPKTSSGDDVEAKAREALAGLTVARDVQVGSVNRVTSKTYVDLMGACTAPGNAEFFAAMLVQRWRTLVRTDAKEGVFEFVVTPKNGSPILGYEFAKMVQRPLALHNEALKFRGTDQEPAAVFDFRERPSEGARALVVDDSTTGGDKVLKAVHALRMHGYRVTDCLVVFEPTVKDARSRLRAQNVTLHSVATWPT